MAGEYASKEFYDYKPTTSDFKREVLEGLTRIPKSIPPKFFYDKEGSVLFDRITELPEYYLTRSEIEILNRYGEEIISQIGQESLLIEYGSGSSNKTGLLLQYFTGNTAYMPIDISGKHLFESSEALKRKFPNIRIIAVCADYTSNPDLPIPDKANKKAILFLGSTIGNMEPDRALKFLKDTSSILGAGDVMIIGFDLKKERTKIENAYNDSSGVTALFNLNLLKRINREFEASIDLGKFRHVSFYNSEKGRIEMHLESLMDQDYTLSGTSIHFRKGETIHTENSYKYDIGEVHDLCSKAGFSRSIEWFDSNRNYGLFCFQK